MSEYLNARCSICNTAYHVCNDCTKTESFTPWRKIACSVNCYGIYMALSGYTNGKSSKNETKDILSKYDLSNLNSFRENIKKCILDIQKEEQKIVPSTVEISKQNDYKSKKSYFEKKYQKNDVSISNNETIDNE